MRQLSGVRWLVAVAVGFLAAGAGAQVMWLGDPQGERPGPGAPPPGGRQAMIRELGLSEEQQEKVREIQDEQRAQREALFEKIAANRDALRRMLESGDADATAVGELVLAGRKLHDESRALRDAEQRAIRGVLTPEQQKKFDAIQDKRRERGPGHGPEGFPGPGRPPGGPGAMPGGSGPGMPRPPQGQSRSGQSPFSR